jgi:hypothetical protein
MLSNELCRKLIFFFKKKVMEIQDDVQYYLECNQV